MALVMIDRPMTYGEAFGLRAFIEAHGYFCTVFDFNHFAFGWHTQIAVGGMRVMVNREDSDAIHELLQMDSKESSSKLCRLQSGVSNATDIDARIRTALWVIFGMCVVFYTGIPIPRAKRSMRRARLIYLRSRL